MARCSLIWTSFLLLLLVPGVGHSQVTYDKRSGNLSIKAEDQPLTVLLAEVSAKTGIEISIAPAADRSVSVDIRALPVEDAIRELIGPLNSLFVYRGNTSMVKAVKIFGASSSDATVTIGPAAPSAAVSAGRKLPPSQAELEARANQRWEQHAKVRGKPEDSDGRKKHEEERAAWESRDAALKAERDEQIAAQQADGLKYLEEARKHFAPH